jgi:sigma-B regulation protein RsbU (phosphoserine phosphatase)
MPIRALLVDDEEPARDRLRGLLTEIEGIEVVGEACDGTDAVQLIQASRPDLVFLDIEMPGLSGMEVASSLAPPRPRIIFCTAYDQYAIEAFEQHATDYLLKPVNRARLEKAVGRVRQTVLEQESARREVEDATRTQARLLPQCRPPMARLDYDGLCRPARGVAGDYYDFLDLGPGALGLVMADVSGKGMFAGLLMASLQARIQSIAPRHGRELDELVCEANRLMHSSTDINRYATFFYGVFDNATRELTYVNAGHLPPIVLRPRGAGATDRPTYEVLRLESNGTVIGLLPEACYRQSTMSLREGDLFCAFTDGITEALNGDGEEFGEKRLEQVLMRHAGESAGEICRQVLATLDRFADGASRRDDETLVVGKVG